VPREGRKKVLEVGCGTGSFTKEILKTLRAGDTFHIVELNPEFCNAVEKTLLAPFRLNNPDIHVRMHNMPIEEAEIDCTFDAIICGLPFNNFPVALVQHLFSVMFGLLKKDAVLAYFEYLGMRSIKSLFGFSSVRKETKQRTTDINKRFQKHHGTQVNVYKNIPPSRVVSLKGC